MIKEIIGTGRTVEAAIADGAEKLCVDASRVEYEIIEAPKKGFLGFGEAPAQVRVFFEAGPEQTAVDYVNNIMKSMEINGVTASISRGLNSEGGKIIKVQGEQAGVLIGRHGETLDALQYLANLALNNSLEESGEECEKISLDIEGYRARREETLKNLARRTAEKVKKYRKNITLEPMTPYERRIIHSALQNESAVTTASIGSDENRRVVVHYVPKTKKPAFEKAAEKVISEDETTEIYESGIIEETVDEVSKDTLAE
jgi:spoIIIJ-associated protein